jgi:hypothetical protein
MTGVEVVVAALAAGAGAGTGEAAKAAVVDAYAGLRDALRRRLRGQTGIEDALDGVQAEPGETRVDLVAALGKSGAADDPEVLAAARRLLALADPVRSAAGKYQVDAGEAKGVQIGDRNVQHNSFT